ncbi:hypothetical protein BCF74_13120 [Knoellia remsis]|uniref:Uncharacterized protein n=1 Tax=Knoellia remsis TaxID=407159 RepID=A0A2T0U4Q8_9MICO|nr:hypothetical protein [Knoellia remsis]PRY52880.1 hypothetical protein BCF74_13120 [Knoellia remsis]
MPDQSTPTPVGATSGSSPDAASDTASDAVAQANTALEAGRLHEARVLLAERVELERDIEALRLLGEVHHGLGDLPAAGAAWFGAGVRGPEVDAAVEAWRAEHDDDFLAMWRSLPRSVRQAPRSKKVDALRTKAQEVKKNAAAETESHSPAGEAPAAVGTPPASAGSPVPRAVGSSAPVVEDADGEARGSSPSTAVTKVASKAVSKVSSGAGGGGIDAAQIIAWVIAAFVVLCAVVGLVTILRWLVPG